MSRVHYPAIHHRLFLERCGRRHPHLPAPRLAADSYTGYVQRYRRVSSQ
jgi:hypothetical protein